MRLGVTSLSVTRPGPGKKKKSSASSPPPIVYNLTAPTSVDEGATLVCNVSANLPSGDGTLYWDISHVTTNASDFTAVSGTVTVSSQSGSFNISAVADNVTEGAETFDINLRTGSASGPIVSQITGVTVNDTSIAPVTSYYNFYTHNWGTRMRSSYVYVQNQSTMLWTQMLSISSNTNTWISRSINLQQFQGQQIKIGHVHTRYSTSYTNWFANDAAIDNLLLVRGVNTTDLSATGVPVTDDANWVTNGSTCHSSIIVALNGATQNLANSVTSNMWCVGTGSTGSSNTGPSSAYTGSYYFYFEASSMTSSCNYDYAAIVTNNAYQL
tara:strand:- start:850 stop:1827 length:978 start_codon:yes stop_codon:yes gene_type:complete